MPDLFPAVPTHSTMLDERLPALRARLLAQRQFRLDQLATLDAATEPHDEIDQALHDAARSVLADIETALGHIARGDYGRCQSCLTAEIPIEWLAVLPTAALCPDCLQARANAS